MISFDNTSWRRIARLIEDTYGYRDGSEGYSLFRLSVSGDLRAPMYRNW